MVLLMKTNVAQLYSKMEMETKVCATGCSPLIHHLLEVKISSSFSLFLHHTVYFETTLYLASHFSYSSAAFRKIAQAGGGGPGQGELLCHGVLRFCLYKLLLYLLSVGDALRVILILDIN